MTSPFPKGRVRAARFKPCDVFVISAIDDAGALINCPIRSRAVANTGNNISGDNRCGSARVRIHSCCVSRARWGIGPVDA